MQLKTKNSHTSRAIKFTRILSLQTQCGKLKTYSLKEYVVHLGLMMINT